MLNAQSPITDPASASCSLRSPLLAKASRNARVESVRRDGHGAISSRSCICEAMWEDFCALIRHVFSFSCSPNKQEDPECRSTSTIARRRTRTRPRTTSKLTAIATLLMRARRRLQGVDGAGRRGASASPSPSARQRRGHPGFDRARRRGSPPPQVSNSCKRGPGQSAGPPFAWSRAAFAPDQGRRRRRIGRSAADSASPPAGPSTSARASSSRRTAAESAPISSSRRATWATAA